jgi:hypothetical protein
MEFALNVPANQVSFGQVSIAILREIHKRGYEPAIFPIGQFDFTGQKLTQAFADWVNRGIHRGLTEYKRSTPIIKLWHIWEALSSYAEKQVLYAFHEVDAATPLEINVVRNQHKTIFSSKYSRAIFKAHSLFNVSNAPLGFDKENFSIKPKKFFSDGRVVFNLAGKLENRKHHLKTLKAWVKKYGNNPRYALQCSLFNSFLRPEDQQQMLAQALENKRYFNIEFLPFMSTNEEYNDYLNSANIILGMSGGEGFGLPEMQSIALGKHAVILDAHGYQEFATKENAVLVKPSNKIEVYDNIFFQKGLPWNQGNIHDWREEDFIEGCEAAIERVKKNDVNEAGLELQNKFTYSGLVDSLLEALK